MVKIGTNWEPISTQSYCTEGGPPALPATPSCRACSVMSEVCENVRKIIIMEVASYVKWRLMFTFTGVNIKATGAGLGKGVGPPLHACASKLHAQSRSVLPEETARQAFSSHPSHPPLARKQARQRGMSSSPVLRTPQGSQLRTGLH